MVERLFLEFSQNKLLQMQSRIADCLDRLNEDQIWARESETQNSAGNLVLHLCGNVRQWILSGVSGQPGSRDRDAEFAARGGLNREELKNRLKRTVAEVASAIEHLEPARLSDRICVQGYDVSALEAIYHVVEHFSHHTGQIIFATKLLTGDDLGYYRHLANPQAEPDASVP